MRKLFATFVLLLSLSYGSLKHIDIDVTSGLGIIGGSEVSIKEVPFMAIVHGKDSGIAWWCGGTIVGEQHILTAAHCCQSPDYSTVTVRVKVGTDRFSGGQSYDVEKATAYPHKPDENILESDICVLKLKKKLSTSDTVKIISMADKDFKLNDGVLLETIGFGQTKWNGDGSEKLLKVSLPYVPTDRCNKVYDGEISKTMLCAGGLQGKGVCFGDSGSPIFYNGTLVGLTSFAHDESCDQSKYPAVFARISALRPFIDDVINGGL